MTNASSVIDQKEVTEHTDGVTRIGLVALASDPTVEAEFRRMLPADGAQFFVSRSQLRQRLPGRTAAGHGRPYRRCGVADLARSAAQVDRLRMHLGDSCHRTRTVS